MWMVKHIKQALPHAGHICLLKKNHFSNDFIVGQFCGIGGSIFFQKTFLKQLKKFRSIEIFLNKPKFQLSHEFLLESVHYNFVQKIRQHNAFHITSHLSLKFPAIIVLFWLTASRQPIQPTLYWHRMYQIQKPKVEMGSLRLIFYNNLNFMKQNSIIIKPQAI